MHIKNSVVVITGASSGIGRATALRFAAKGARLVLAARGSAALDPLVKACRKRGGKAKGIRSRTQGLSTGELWDGSCIPPKARTS